MIFDLHCDTIDKILRCGERFDVNDLAVSLSEMAKHERAVRCFALWVGDSLKGDDAQAQFQKLYSTFKTQLELHADKIVQITDLESLDNARLGAVLTVENASSLNGKIERIEYYAKIGVKVMSLTWNGENELGFGQPENRGLKPFGKDCVREIERNNIVIDVSHISDKGFDDICALYNKPIVATHSNSRKICNHKRNLTDEQIKEIIKRRGLIGLNFYKLFIEEGGNPTGYDLLKHIEHILSLGGQDVLSLGTDFDGGEMIDCFKNDSLLLDFEGFLCNNGIDKDIAQKITFGNANNFFKRYFKEQDVQK